MPLHWVKSTTGHWLNLDNVNLGPVQAVGVYIIWHGGSNPRVVRVGQGNIAQRLGSHRADIDVTKYRQFGGLFVTWAVVPSYQLDGVERYAAEILKPLVGDRFPFADPIAVNLPWQ